MEINLKDFFYDLPDQRIAKIPVGKRDESKLLFNNRGKISHHSFGAITSLLPKDSQLFCNDTKVIPARIYLRKDTGALIEIFLLNPLAPSNLHEITMTTTNGCTWKCMIGNAKKWSEGLTLIDEKSGLRATRIQEKNVRFEWESGESFAEIIAKVGKIPLPPYLNRESNEEDKERYQTVYSKNDGAVAAPTAGLHFTPEILKSIEQSGIDINYLTLHVSAGTFQPVKTENAVEHPMHEEQVIVTKENIISLLKSQKTVAVGTTSMRTLESLYWYGVKLKNGFKEFTISQDDPYNFEAISKEEALTTILDSFQSNQTYIVGDTSIYIYPGYKFKICDGLITNFHQPGSTLILLVSAFLNGNWRETYQEALENDYRFLSYGDSSLLLR